MNNKFIKRLSLLTLVLAFLTCGCTEGSKLEEEIDLEMGDEASQKTLQPGQLFPEETEEKGSLSEIQEVEKQGEGEDTKIELEVQKQAIKKYKFEDLKETKSEDLIIILE